MVAMATVEMTLPTMMLDKREDPKKLAAGELDELHSQTCIPLTGQRNELEKHLDQSMLHLQQR
jgi:hypothetical protein